jgi:hypothetical protein
MLVLGVVVAVPMPMSSTVGVHVFVLVEDDLKMASERLGNTAERFQAGDMSPRSRREIIDSVIRSRATNCFCASPAAVG